MDIKLAPAPLDPLVDDRRHEVAACPTGLSEPAAQPLAPEAGGAKLGVEKLEGRLESGRDAQDEAEQDEPQGP